MFALVCRISLKWFYKSPCLSCLLPAELNEFALIRVFIDQAALADKWDPKLEVALEVVYDIWRKQRLRRI